MLNKKVIMRIWWNGRHAGFRFQSERVQVQLLLSAPEKNKTNLENEKLSQSKFVLFFNSDWFGIAQNYKFKHE